jgi:ferrous-iron efflux pump FieF
VTDGKRDEGRNARLMRLATYASVAVAVVLILVKTVAWFMTDSVAILSSLIDSWLDALASIVNLLAVRHALHPADREHRFGHGKLESLAGLGQSAFIAGSALLLLFEAGHRLFAPAPVSNELVGMGVMVFTIVLTMILVRFQIYVVRTTKSVAINADSLHYKGDILLNGSVLISLAASMSLGWSFLDPIFAIAIAGYILWNAWRIVAQSLHVLMDRELPDEDRDRIREIALSHPEVHEMHDLRSRTSEMDGNMKLAQAHDIADAVEAEIRAAYPEAEVIIHQDPEGLAEDHADFA